MEYEEGFLPGNETKSMETSKKCKRPNCQNVAPPRAQGRRGYCQKHWNLLPDRGYIPSPPVADRIRELRSVGYSMADISELTGLDKTTLDRIVAGRRKQVQVNTYLMLMGVPSPSTFVAKGVHNQGRLRIPNVGTRRRLRALAAIGYSLEHLAKEFGVTVTPVHQWMTRDHVAPETACRVRDVFERLQALPGPSNNAALRAKAKGWPPPMAWDEDTIDDPDAEPYDVERDNKKPKGWWFDSYWELRQMGMTDTQLIADRLGVPFETIDRQIKRWNARAA